MTFLLNEQDTFVYNQTMTPTKPRFKVGDIVYAHARQVIGGYRLSMNFSNEVIRDYVNRNDITEDDIIVEPAIFGVVVDVPEPGTMVLESETVSRNFEPRGWCLDESESVIDLPGSGSVWFLPDEERRYFVKWLNKETRTKREHSHHIPFKPLKRADGSQVQNLSLHYENCLCKAPDFVQKVRGIARKKKMSVVRKVLHSKLNIDYYSTCGLADIVCAF